MWRAWEDALRIWECCTKYTSLSFGGIGGGDSSNTSSGFFFLRKNWENMPVFPDEAGGGEYDGDSETDLRMCMSNGFGNAFSVTMADAWDTERSICMK